MPYLTYKYTYPLCFPSFNLTAADQDPQHHTPSIVVSADFTIGYLYKILNDTLAACSQPTARCFLIEDRGYVIAHPGLNAALHRRPDARLHLTHLEPFVATDLLAHHSGSFISKQVCRAPLSGNLQRYMELRTDYAGGVVTNSGRSAGCGGPPLYYLSSVPNTNIFLGVVEQPPLCSSNSTTNTAFCWCSTLDRTCLDCQHWEQGECECPCECEPAAKDDDKYCALAGDDSNDDDDDSVAIHPCRNTGELFNDDAAHSRAKPRFFSTSRTNNYHLLPPCIHTDCAGRGATEAECFGVLGCAWCSAEVDGLTPLSQPFCAAQAECFSGVLGSPSPYSRVPRSGEQSSSSLLADTLDERSGFRCVKYGVLCPEFRSDPFSFYIH